LCSRTPRPTASTLFPYTTLFRSVVDQAAREFLLLMEPMLHLAPFGDIHDRALVPDDLSASVAHGGGAVHAHDRASIFAEKRDFAALDHRLRLHLLLQGLAFGGIDKNLG